MVRVLLVVDAAFRATGEPVSDENLYRLDYFVDAFSRLWRLDALDRYRQKVDEPRSLEIRRALDRLVVSGLVVPSEVVVDAGLIPRVSAVYHLDSSAEPVLGAARRTRVGEREWRLVDEVVFAASSLLDHDFDDAVHLDSTFSDRRLGPNDVLDLESTDDLSTSSMAQRFESAISSMSHREAELTHLYLGHMERAIRNDRG